MCHAWRDTQKNRTFKKRTKNLHTHGSTRGRRHVTETRTLYRANTSSLLSRTHTHTNGKTDCGKDGQRASKIFEKRWNNKTGIIFEINIWWNNKTGIIFSGLSDSIQGNTRTDYLLQHASASTWLKNSSNKLRKLSRSFPLLRCWDLWNFSIDGSEGLWEGFLSP